MESFRESGQHVALVHDEYGGIEGIVTLNDVLQAIVGEIPSAEDTDPMVVHREDGSWLLDGLIPIPELKDRLAFREAPEEDKGRYHTLSGMMMWLLGRLPRTGDVAEWERWRLEVVDLDGKRVDKVLASRLPEPQEAPPEEGAGAPPEP